MLKRMGYVIEHTATSSKTGFYSDDEDVESSSDYNWETLIKYGRLHKVKMRYRYHEFNDITLDEVCWSEFRYAVKESSDLNSVEINYPGDLIRQRSNRDPQGRGSKMFKDKLRGYVDIVLSDGSIKKAIRKHKCVK